MNETKTDPNQAWNLFLANYKEGDVIRGITTDRQGNTVAYLDLEGVKGILRWQDATWSRGPQLPFPGDRVYCHILQINHEDKTVDLLGPVSGWELWLRAVERLTIGSCHRGEVVNLDSFGRAHIKIEAGVEGLILPTELEKMAPDKRARLAVADEIEVVVLSVQKNPKELILGLIDESAN